MQEKLINNLEISCNSIIAFLVPGAIVPILTMLLPCFQTNPAEMILTGFADHVIASAIFFNWYFARFIRARLKWQQKSKNNVNTVEVFFGALLLPCAIGKFDLKKLECWRNYFPCKYEILGENNYMPVAVKTCVILLDIFSRSAPCSDSCSSCQDLVFLEFFGKILPKKIFNRFLAQTNKTFQDRSQATMIIRM